MKFNLPKTTVRALTVLAGLALLLSIPSCAPEYMIEAKDVDIWNYDSIPMEIYVNGEKALTFDNRRYGSVYLNSGDYELVAKYEGKELDRINVSVPRKKESNKYNKQIWIVGKKKNFAYFNVGEIYEGDGEIELLDKFLETNYMELECTNFRFYYPHNRLPQSVYSTGDPDVYQIVEIPDPYIGKEDIDERLLKFMKLRSAF